MSVAPGKYRRINIGFKPAGTDPLQDQAFEILQALNKKGAKSHFISISISEYISAHQSVIGSGSMGTILVLSSTTTTKNIEKCKKNDNSSEKQINSDTITKLDKPSRSKEELAQLQQSEKFMDENDAEQINGILDLFGI